MQGGARRAVGYFFGALEKLLILLAGEIAIAHAVLVDRLQELAELYADPDTRVMSLWTMGFNQHTRGVWCNNLVYNIHLLTGKIATPGNSPFSLTGQPSACGTARAPRRRWSTPWRKSVGAR